MASAEDGVLDQSVDVGITVVVLADDVTSLPRCIQSVATQSLSHQQMDVVVVVDAAVDFASIAAARSQYPNLEMRSVALSKWTPASAHAAGVAAARQPYLTFVSSSDTLQRRFLEALLGASDGETISAARVIDVSPSSNEENAAPAGEGASVDTVRGLEVHEVPTALSFDMAKLVPTAWAKRAVGDRTDEDHVAFWARLYVRQALGVVLVEGTDCAYERHRAAQTSATGAFEAGVTQRVARLERLDSLMDEAVENQTREVLRKWMDDEASAIGRYLRNHAADRPKAVEALDRSAIFHLPSSRLNEGMASGLVISYCFPPYVDTAAVVAAKRVRERGEIVDVVYNAMDAIRGTDITTRRIAGPFINDEAVVSSPTAFANWASMESFRELGMEQILAWEQQKGPYGSMYSRAQFAASHFLAAAYKLHHPPTRWTAEFSDPLSRDVRGEERGEPVDDCPFLQQLSQAFRERGVEPPDSENAFLWCEWTAYVLADELLFTNRNQLEYMKRFIPESVAEMVERKAIIAPHPTLPWQFYNMVEHKYDLRDNVVNLAYFGNFYATRGLDDVLLAIAGLPDEIRRHIALHVFTNTGQELQERVKQLGLSGVVLVQQYVDFLHFLNLTTKFDCLVVNDAATAPDVTNPYLPSKWSDYQGSRTPVWGLVEEGSALSGVPLSYRSPIGHVSAAQQVLAGLVAAKLSRRPIFEPHAVDLSAV